MTRHITGTRSEWLAARLELLEAETKLTRRSDELRGGGRSRWFASKEKSQMPDILHRVEINSSFNDTYRALSTREGLAGWWTTDTQGDCDVGGVIQFRFGTRGRIDMKVLELDPGKRVLWQVVSGPPEWIGTKVSFELTQDDNFTIILFKHQGWKEPVEFMHHCSTKWALFPMSMKSLLETGKGAPYPNDIHITNKGG